VVGEVEIEDVDGFCYLGRELVCDGTDWPAASKNLRKARGRWATVSRVLSREHANPKIAGYFYKAVVQSILLYACETWVLSQSIRTAFAGFHHQVARRLTNHRIRLDPRTQQWVYPSSNQALQDAGLYRMETYMASRRDHTLAKVQGSPLFLATQDPQGGVGGSTWDPYSLDSRSLEGAYYCYGA
jgi:hypothetical protein